MYNRKFEAASNDFCDRIVAKSYEIKQRKNWREVVCDLFSPSSTFCIRPHLAFAAVAFVFFVGAASGFAIDSAAPTVLDVMEEVYIGE